VVNTLACKSEITTVKKFYSAGSREEAVQSNQIATTETLCCHLLKKCGVLMNPPFYHSDIFLSL
jgi:hypothetical protein